MCFAWFSEEVATICLYKIINWLDFIKDAERVFCTVRTVSLNILQINFGYLSKIFHELDE